MMKTKESIKVSHDGEKLIFTNSCMKLEIKSKVSENSFVEFFLLIYSEIVLLKSKLKDKKTKKLIEQYMLN